MLVDITTFLTRDAYGVTEALRRAKQGAFKLDPSLSHPDLDAALTFPENLEFEATQTFTALEPGDEVRGIAPDPHSITLTTHHSLIKLPPPGFESRVADPHFSTIDKLVTNYAAPLSSPLAYRLAPRFRLEKLEPAAARSRVKKPIVFYVDRAAPEPVRSALIEGASWWAEAFDKAGYIDAFQVKLLPEGVSPLDARYNVINWVHRQTRGWSYGEGISDPRTGEIIKGSVLLGSQRVRQTGSSTRACWAFRTAARAARTTPCGSLSPASGNWRCHETGHALGFAHNFAGSTIGRASVDDYPPPRVLIRDGKLDLSDAYATGVGAWDLFVVDWLYSEAPPGADQNAALTKIVSDGFASGLKFVSDDDARPVGSANPIGSLWDDGPDPVEGLKHTLEVRRIALAQFGLRNVPLGAPVSDLRRIIVPVYLFHRYEVDAAAKLIGGVDYTYAANGDGHERAEAVSGDRQRAALGELLTTVEPAALDLPRALDRASEQRPVGHARPAVRNRGVRRRRHPGVRPSRSRRCRRRHHLHGHARPQPPEPRRRPGGPAAGGVDPRRPARRGGGRGVRRPPVRPRPRRRDPSAGEDGVWCRTLRGPGTTSASRPAPRRKSTPRCWIWVGVSSRRGRPARSTGPLPRAWRNNWPSRDR